MEQSARRQEQESLAAISTLKRALGIPNHLTKIDEVVEDRWHVYTQDAKSAELISELLYRCANGNLKQFYDSQPRRSVRDTISVSPLKDGGFEASIKVINIPNFTKGLLKLAQKHISPDKNFTR